MHQELRSRLDHAVRAAIDRGEIPGAVVDIAHRGRTLVRKAYGFRKVVGKRERMTVSTVFDLASVTKVAATSLAIARLVDRGDLAMGIRASRFLPGLRRGRKRDITVTHLLTHTSGLPAYDNYLRRGFTNAEDVVADIAARRLPHAPGSKFVYSDLGAILLAKIVEAVAGVPFDAFCMAEVFGPLGMTDTCFNPAKTLRSRCAPTARRRGKLLRGEVHDENAFVLGGAAGHAGLFSTVSDLRRLADMILAEGWTPHGLFLRAQTVREFLRPRRLPDGNVRGLGWDVDSPYSSVRGHVFPFGSVGHSGFTGTSIWLDPAARTSVIILSNRVHPDDGGDAKPVRAQVASIAAAMAQAAPAVPSTGVETGLDRLVQDDCSMLRGSRVGLVANHTAIDRDGRHLLDHLLAREGLTVAAIFSPEHGFEGKLDEHVPSSQHAACGLPIHSLYGEHRAPTPAMLDGIDTLVFDIQDIGTRFYTYAATLCLCMRAAARAGIRFIVLDRPNPINGIDTCGPVLKRGIKSSLVAHLPIPMRHGLTIGELATFANLTLRIGCDLRVAKMSRWQRGMFFDETGLPWANPSPNMRNLKQAILYPAIGALEFSNVSVGRGTDTPFEVMGAPWIDAVGFAQALNERGLPGLSFTPIWFQPASSKYEGLRCGGVYIMLGHRTRFRPGLTALTIAQVLHQLFGKRHELGRTRILFGDAQAVRDARRGVPVARIAARWDRALQAFADITQEVQLY